MPAKRVPMRQIRELLRLKRACQMSNRQSGEQAGDDIIIYDQQRFTSLGLRDANDFSRKEFIPIEAVFGYIEAKYTLNLTGDDGQSFAKATSQVQAVKALCNTRKRMEIGDLRHMSFGSLAIPDPNWPDFRNPAWSAVFASRVRDKKDGKLLESFNDIEKTLEKIGVKGLPSSDSFVLGPDVCTIPVFHNHEKEATTISHFHVNEKTTHFTKHTPAIAAGIGLSLMLGAFDWILLGLLPWQSIVCESLGTDPALLNSLDL